MRSAGVGRPTDIYDLKVRVRMSQEMMDKTCRGFAEALAAREPVPGGGSASAFVGALGASLCGMVARYGATNPALADRADDLTRAFAQADELVQELVIGCPGSPPRVREKRDFNCECPGFLGITPACAGKTLSTHSMMACMRDHPRVCGKNVGDVVKDPVGSGSPPRVREKLA